ncbi:MAG: PKD domain-containing protein [Paludibacter sp.]|nr:PKD domain-containing protein [Paludibacter sp.]
MNRKINGFICCFIILLSVAACKTSVEPDFSYSPELPKAGEKVSFTNLTEGDETWSWTFGDGGSSTAENPTHTFKKPGKYNVTLSVNSNKNDVCTRQVVVYDSLPSIYIEGGSVKYYQPTEFSVLVYNPYGYDVTYEWTFSANAHSVSIDENGKSTKSALSVYFSQKNVEETVHLELTVGDSLYKIDKKFLVENVQARSIVMAAKDGRILRQRIFDKGLEDYTQTAFSSGKHPFYIQCLSNKLYIFDAGTYVGATKEELNGKAGDGSIRKIDFETGVSTEIVNNGNVGAEHGFYNGFVDGSSIYWTDFSQFVYKTPNNNSVLGSFDWRGSDDAQTAVPFYLAKVDRLGYYGNGLANDQMSGGIYFYDNIYFWAKTGSGRGIYRFSANDILGSNVTGAGTPPQSGTILADFAVRAFAIDNINQKIYFSVTAPADKTGFWVANLSGTNPVRIDDAPMDAPSEYITGIVVDNVTNKVYWAYRAPAHLSEDYFVQNPKHRTGVKCVRLAKSNSVYKDIEYFAPGVEVYGIAIDEVVK